MTRFATEREQKLYEALLLTSGALALVVHSMPSLESRQITFTSDHAPLGTISFSWVLDLADEVLGSAEAPPERNTP